ncbi:DUF1579 domain-containing protein [Brevundimonas sp.]|uniref:DUF1579 domain-containing protein n=1 Tax=Brevundimonas sp. TaxID=1871086 RepID=UPI00262B2B4F|nr:DUF1579 domain-containing protein [Brevundimonas sp.]
MTPQPAGTAEQRDAMARLSWMDGEWVGEAESYAGPGRTSTHPHTERIGPMLGGSIKVIEGRSVGAGGETLFNAFAILSWNDAEDRYVFRSYANGQAADFPFEATAEGFAWTVPANGGEVRYVTTFKDGEWIEVGDFVMPGREPMRVIELRLRRRGDSTWPAEGAVIP